jgi:hypothetical protein
MAALATRKDTHISVVVPMTGYALATLFPLYVLYEDCQVAQGKTDIEKDQNTDIGTKQEIVEY